MSEIRDEALGQWPRILEAAGVDPNHLNGRFHPCPACGGKDRFRYHVREGEHANPNMGTYFCNGCGAGDGMKLLIAIRGGGFADSAAFAREVLGNTNYKPLPLIQHSEQSKERDAERIQKSLARTAQGCNRVMPGDMVWQYLIGTRWLELNEVPKAIKIHPNLGYYEEGDGGKMVKVGEFPAMVAVVRAPDGRAVSLHRTYLTKNATVVTKAPVECPKKLMAGLEGCEGGAIRLFPATEVLALAEGIETALAVHCLTGLPVWATISSGKMKSIVIPDYVKEVLIYADNDIPDRKGRRAGQEAANSLRTRLESEGKKVTIVLPQTPGTDFADIWKAKCEDKAADKIAA